MGREIFVDTWDASQRTQNVSWALAGAESIHVCGAGDDLIKLLWEAGSCQTRTLQAMQ